MVLHVNIRQEHAVEANSFCITWRSQLAPPKTLPKLLSDIEGIFTETTSTMRLIVTGNRFILIPSLQTSMVLNVFSALKAGFPGISFLLTNSRRSGWRAC